MKTLKNILLLPFVILMVFASSSCKKDNSPSSASTGHLTVKMTDAPADYQAVYIEVLDVKVNASGDEAGWVSVAGIRPGVYNLLELANGLDTLLADGEIPAGYISQIRLILGDSNFVVVDSLSYELETPSAQQSGLKINVQQNLPAGGALTLLLDFDAAKSIVETGSGKYQLKPVIRLVGATSASGNITGELVPGMVAQVSAGPMDEYNTYSNEEGKFKLKGLPAGTYTVTIKAAEGSGFADKTITDIVVVNGETTDLGEITM